MLNPDHLGPRVPIHDTAMSPWQPQAERWPQPHRPGNAAAPGPPPAPRPSPPVTQGRWRQPQRSPCGCPGRLPRGAGAAVPSPPRALTVSSLSFFTPVSARPGQQALPPDVTGGAAAGALGLPSTSRLPAPPRRPRAPKAPRLPRPSSGAQANPTEDLAGCLRPPSPTAGGQTLQPAGPHSCPP